MKLIIDVPDIDDDDLKEMQKSALKHVAWTDSRNRFSGARISSIEKEKKTQDLSADFSRIFYDEPRSTGIPSISYVRNLHDSPGWAGNEMVERLRNQPIENPLEHPPRTE